MNIRQVLKNYKHVFHVNGELSKEEILKDIDKLLRHKKIQYSPRKSQKILVLGAPGAGSTTLSKHLSQKFGFVHVSIN